MSLCSTIGLELPSPGHAGPEAQALLYYDGQLVATGTPCPGRLVPPRRLGRELDRLLRGYLEQVRAEADALRHYHAFAAQQKLAAAKGWVRAVRRAHCTPHHLRLRQTERLHCWRLPASYCKHPLFRRSGL